MLVKKPTISLLAFTAIFVAGTSFVHAMDYPQIPQIDVDPMTLHSPTPYPISEKNEEYAKEMKSRVGREIAVTEALGGHVLLKSLFTADADAAEKEQSVEKMSAIVNAVEYRGVWNLCSADRQFSQALRTKIDKLAFEQVQKNLISAKNNEPIEEMDILSGTGVSKAILPPVLQYLLLNKQKAMIDKKEADAAEKLREKAQDQ